MAKPFNNVTFQSVAKFYIFIARKESLSIFTHNCHSVIVFYKTGTITNVPIFALAIQMYVRTNIELVVRWTKFATVYFHIAILSIYYVLPRRHVVVHLRWLPLSLFSFFPFPFLFLYEIGAHETRICIIGRGAIDEAQWLKLNAINYWSNISANAMIGLVCRI